MVSAQSQKVATVVSGHHAAGPDDAWCGINGVACHPKKQEFATCGSDRRVRIWTPTALLATAEFKHEVVSLGWSPCGRFLIAGDSIGQIHSLDAESHKIISTCASKAQAQRKEAKVQVLKIAPDGKRVAFCVAGSAAVDLAVIQPNGFTVEHEKCLQVGQPVTHLDWSADSELLALNSKVELLFYRLQSDKVVPASAVAGVEWASWTCKLGFDVQGIWPENDCQAVNAVATASSKQVVASAEATGALKLFRYPSTVPQS